jgi:putative heme degradation protein
MVQHRRLKERLDAGLTKAGGANAEDLQKTLQELKAREKAYDRDVAGLMEADESVSQEIAAAEATINENRTTIKALTEQLDALDEAQKLNPGKAMVKIGGNIFAGTRFTGPHSTLVLQEDFKRTSIVETDKPDSAGVKRWRFELAPFR